MSRRFERNVIKFLEMLHYSEEPGLTGKFVKRYCKRQSEYNHLIDYLKRKKFIIKGKLDGKDVTILQLTDDGIDFLRERKKEKHQEEFNRIVAFTASILALIGIYEFLSELSVIEKNGWITPFFAIFVIIALIPITKFLINPYR